MTAPTDIRLCAHAEHCRGFDRTARQPAETAGNPLCTRCLDSHERDLRGLLWDWLDLEQLQMPSLAQSLTGQPNGSTEPAMPMAGGPEALQSEIAHVLATWEDVIRDRHRLADVPATRRQGPTVQRAVTLLAPRVDILSRLDATTVYPTGCEDTPTDMTGVEALTHISHLHQRARAMLGRTRRTYWVPGDCGLCGAQPTEGVPGPLYRHEPRHEGDESPVWCDHCDGWRSHDDYERYVTMLVWPQLHHDQDEATA